MNKQIKYFLITFIIYFGINNSVLLAQEKNEIQHIVFENNQQAEQLYEQGKLVEAIALLQKQIQTYQQRGEIVKQAYALRNLSLIYLQQGNWQATETNIEQALTLTDQINDHSQRNLLLNLCLEVQGQLQLAIDQPEIALQTWQRISQIAEQRGDIQQWLKSEIKQVQTLQDLGLYAQAVNLLIQLEPKIATAKPDLVTAKAWQTTGELLGKVGQYSEAESALKQGLAIVSSQGNTQAQADLLIILGRLAHAQQNFDSAHDFYQQAIETSEDQFLQLQAYLSQLNLLVEQESGSQTSSLIQQILPLINNLPTSKNLVNHHINLALNLSQIEPANQQLIVNQLSKAIQQARQIDYRRGEANALGHLGKLYQQQQRLSEARKLSERALLISQQIDAPDLAYQWQWQLGQILAKQNKRESAIASYAQAVNTLQTLRRDLVALSSDLEFNFRENIEPVHRELVDILLQGEPTSREISQARDVIEALQLAELDNFFRSACIDSKPVLIDQITDQQDPTSAIVYTIMLGDRLEIILKLPQQELRNYSIKIANQAQVEIILARLAQSLTQRNSQETLPLAQQAYDWLIRPIADDLETTGVETLVFVLDSPLRNVPMSVLHDGKEFLVEKYAVVLSPGLKLIEPQPITQKQLNVLAAGLTEARAGFAPLQYVGDELAVVQSQVNRTEKLLNQDFTNQIFQSTINQVPFPVVHLATHGQFSSQVENTFILTWDDRLNINQINSLLRSSNLKRDEALELLVLSACETLVGDKRATLGLAGVAVRAGARSTLATLWRVNDEATALLMGEFYQELANRDPSLTKAQALRQAQLGLLKSSRFNKPYFWAPYVLVGNWL